MIKQKFFIFILTAIMIISSTACSKGPDDKLNDGWQNAVAGLNKNEDISDMQDETTSHNKVEIDSSGKDKVKIVFSAEKATNLGTFESDIYGLMNVFLQDGYLLIYDEESRRRFTVFAENYSPSMTGGEIELIGEDMNYDGHTDLRILFQKDSLNSYYYCFLLDINIKTFTYFLPLSSLASPKFDKEKNVIMSYERLGSGETIETAYRWQDGELNEISKFTVPAKEKETDAEDSTRADYDIEPEYTYEDGKSIASITLNTNRDSSCTWLCRIENEDVVYITEKAFNKEMSSQKISLSAAGEGQTTIILRYSASWNDDYTAELIINAEVDDEGNITLIMPET